MVDETLDKVLLLPDDRQVVFLEKLLELWSVVCFVKHVMLM